MAQNSSQNFSDSLQALSQKWFYILTVGGGLVLFALAGVFWWRQIYLDPNRAFWGMINTSLSSPGVTKQVIQKTADNDMDQIVQLNFGSQNTAWARTTLSQKNPTGSAKSTVQTETIGTLQADYARYVSIDDSTKKPDGKKADFSKIVGIWGKNEAASGSKGGRFLSESLLNIVPMANLTGSKRRELVSMMQKKHVYNYDAAKVETSTVHGRRRYTYHIKLRPGDYVQILQTFAKDIGLGEVDGLSPEAYQNAPETAVDITVDAISRQLVSVNYDQGQQRTELYRGYGATSGQPLPAHTISLAELQDRLQKL